MLLVQEYLTEKSFGDLAKDHGVYASFNKGGTKASINYDQIEAKENDPLAQECRGLILSAGDHRSFLSEAIEVNGKLSYDHICPGRTRIISYPFSRFFNYGQGAAANVNWSDPNVKIMEKLDGTLMIIYFCPISNVWHAATRAVPEADLLMDNQKYTFRTLFEVAVEKTLNLSFNDFTSKLDKELTYMFELTSAYNRVVVEYKGPSITLLGARNINTLQEIDTNDIDLIVPRARTYTLTNIDEILEYVSSQNPSEHEGVVVCDGKFNRVKIKNPAYVIAHRLKDTISASPRNLLECILTGKDDDIIPMLPEEIVNDVKVAKEKLQKLMHKYDMTYDAIIKSLDAGFSKKDFALAVQKQNIWAAPLYKMLDKKVNMREFIDLNKVDSHWNTSFIDNLLGAMENV